MKKIFMILGACLMAALVVFSCKKSTTPSKQEEQKQEEQKQEEQKQEEQKEEEKEFSMEVAIDGDFAEWDALTLDTADGDKYAYEENASETLNGLLRVKASYDKDYVFIYAEVAYENVFQGEGGPFEPGNSNDGFHGTKHPGTPGPLWIWIDGDGDANGAVSTADEAEALWDYAGFDAPIQYYFCYDVEQGKMQLGWQQVNWPMDGEEFLTKDSEDWGRAFVGGEGWNPETDWKASSPTDVMFSAPVKVSDPLTKKEVEVIKIELAIDRGGVLPSGDAIKGKIALGVDYENVGDGAACAHNYLSEISGKLPSGNKPFYLNLQ